jgi:hypothetical protein
MGMPEWLWGAAFIAVLLVVGWAADWRTKRQYHRPATNRLIRMRSGHAGRAAPSSRGSGHAGRAAPSGRASS